MKVLDNYSGYAHWALRIALASVFLYHGLPKIPSPGGFANMMGLPVFLVLLVGAMEVAGAVLILVGGFGPDWATRVGGLLLIPPMLGAIAMVHWPRWSFTPADTHPMGGMEFQVTLVLIALYLIFKGNQVRESYAEARA